MCVFFSDNSMYACSLFEDIVVIGHYRGMRHNLVLKEGVTLPKAKRFFSKKDSSSANGVLGAMTV